jgi:hypothetical protein
MCLTISLLHVFSIFFITVYPSQPAYVEHNKGGSSAQPGYGQTTTVVRTYKTILVDDFFSSLQSKTEWE